VTAFTPKDPDYARRVRDSFSRQAFMETLGARIIHLAPGECDVEAPYAPGLSQQHGYFHGGVIATLADNAAGYAAFSLMPADSSVLTVEFKVNLLAPGRGERLVSRSRVSKPGRTLTVSHSRVFACDGGEERLCAEALVTLMTLHGAVDGPAEAGAQSRAGA